MKALLTSALKAVLVFGLVAALPVVVLANGGPLATIILKDRTGQGVPHKCGCAHTGGGNIDVQQPTPDIVVITMSGIGTAAPHPKGSTAAFLFNLDQHFAVVFADKCKKAKLHLSGTVIGLLRGDKHGGCASVDQGAACVSAPGVTLATINIQPHSVCGCDSLSVNDQVGPVCGPIGPGCYHLNQTFSITATHKACLCGKAAAIEFAPDPALDPLWISHWEPFHGCAKKDFGFRVIIRVEGEE